MSDACISLNHSCRDVLMESITKYKYKYKIQIPNIKQIQLQIQIQIQKYNMCYKTQACNTQKHSIIATETCGHRSPVRVF